MIYKTMNDDDLERELDLQLLIPDKEQRLCFEKYCYLFAKAIFDGVQEGHSKFKEVENEKKNI